MTATIVPADGPSRALALERLDSLTKPLGSLGRLEALAAQLCAIQGTVSPRLSAPHALVFAGDHGIARRGVSAYPPEVTAQMVANFVRGGAAISVLARREGFSLTVVDAGVDAHIAPDPRLIDAKVRRGTRDFGFESAMTPAECREALARAERIVDGIAARGSNTLVLGEMGIGNTASASVLMHGLTRLALPDCVGRGTGLDDRGLARKVELLSAACARCAPPGEPLELLTEFGGYEIAMLVGAARAAARARMVVLVDGFTVTVAVLLASRMGPSSSTTAFSVTARRNGRIAPCSRSCRCSPSWTSTCVSGKGAARPWHSTCCARRSRSTPIWRRSSRRA